ncbi:MAG: hypothetical protein L6243_01740 [Candidatus Altiarchaeales archaeon]|nr:hypothetical protein [Candidatus Altiarchaeota archaeon]MCG2782292.1 hypothetical protein [Candidatus Altiarchaeales archaeon]
MGFLDGIFGSRKDERLDGLEKRMDRVESLLDEEYSAIRETEDKILELLSEPKTTDEMAATINLGRSRTSFLINKLEKEGKVKEKEKRGKEIVYVKV